MNAFIGKLSKNHAFILGKTMRKSSKTPKTPISAPHEYPIPATTLHYPHHHPHQDPLEKQVANWPIKLLAVGKKQGRNELT
jgi:hypothetical protein